MVIMNGLMVKLVRYLIVPEFVLMSRRPGIARAWFEKYYKDVYPSDEVIHKGRRMKPLSTMISFLILTSMMKWKSQAKKEIAMQKHLDNNTEERLIVREKVHNARLSMLKRADI